MAKKKLRTPLIKPRQQGGTFYTFASALEDVGLNINELKNKVSLSHYVLLNLPAFDSSVSFSELEGEINQGDYVFAQDFQSYVLNMETVLRNQPKYNFADSLTVSERVFWKYLEKTKAVTFVDDLDKEGNPTGYFVDANNCVQAFGAITSGAQRTDSYGLYNETFVQIPSSYGKMKVLFKNVDDRNFYRHKFYTDSSSDLIEYIDENECPNASIGDFTLHTGLSAKAIFDGEDNGIGYYEVTDEDHRPCVEFSLSELRKYYDEESLTYDDIAITHSIDTSTYFDSSVDSSNYSIDSSLDSSSYYEFNSVLVYYSIYDSTGKNVLATNAYGLLILDNAVSEGEKSYKFPVLVKKKSTLDDIGNSYSFRLNIKTTSVYNGDIIVTDNSTAAYAMSEDFNDTIRNLADSIEILRSNANLIAVMSTDNITIKQLVIQSIDKIDDIEKTLKAMKSGYLKNIKANTAELSQLSTKTIDSSVVFTNTTTGDAVGTVDENTFSFDTIVATNSLSTPAARIDKLNVKKFTLDDDDFTVGNEDGEDMVYARINENGIYTTGQLFTINESSTVNEGEVEKNSIDDITMSSLINGITVYEDGTFRIPNKSVLEEAAIAKKFPGSSIDSATEDDKQEVIDKVTSLYDRLCQQEEEGGDSYVNLSILIACLLNENKALRESYDKVTGNYDNFIRTYNKLATDYMWLRRKVNDLYQESHPEEGRWMEYQFII